MPTDFQAPPRSRNGKRSVAGYFPTDVLRELKKMAAEHDTTLQCLLATAINDLLEKHGKERIANEEPLPRGGAAQKRNREIAGRGE
jgi:hypothetical protein